MRLCRAPDVASSAWVTTVGATVVEREETAMGEYLASMDYSAGAPSLLAATAQASGLSSGFLSASVVERAADTADSDTEGRRLQTWNMVHGQGAAGAAFTTGGGFSARNPMPEWQRVAVEGYLKAVGVDQVTENAGDGEAPKCGGWGCGGHACLGGRTGHGMPLLGSRAEDPR